MNLKKEEKGCKIELEASEWRKIDLKTEQKRKGFVFKTNKIGNVGEKIGNLFYNIGCGLQKGIKNTQNLCIGIFDRYKNSKASKTWLRPAVLRFAASATVAVCVCCIINASDYRLGYEVLIDGQTVGLVMEQDVVYDAINEVKVKVEELGNGRSYEKEPVFVRRVVSESEAETVSALSSKLLDELGYLVSCYSIDVNGTPVLGVASEEAASWVLNKYKTQYISGEITDDTVIEFCEDVKINQNFLNIAMLKTPEEALTLLSGETKETGKYITKENDTLWQIALEHDTTVEKIFAMNDGLTELIHEGMTINVEETVPLLSVKSIQTMELTEAIPFEVETVKDDSMYNDVVEVARDGSEGQAKVIARITKINNTEVERDVLASETLVEPVSKIEKIGTKERPSTTGSGSFIRPAYGSLSSRYGARWGRRHNGIDIAGSYNSPIYAADGGKVTYAGWMDGYGNYVIIDHENGYKTAYGHCASLSVSVGQRVSKGEQIAKMGSTGRSTGTHLHFEVKVNNSYTDPLGYVSY